MVNIVKYNKDTLVTVVMKMISMITKGTKWIIRCFSNLLMRRVLRVKL